jgi:hypothetical protein
MNHYVQHNFKKIGKIFLSFSYKRENVIFNVLSSKYLKRVIIFMDESAIFLDKPENESGFYNFYSIS